LLLILLPAILGGTPTSVRAAERVEITVSAAISLKNAFEELGALYEKQSGVGVLFNFGASGQLLQQLIGGAPVDVFASAAQQDVDEAERRGLLLPDSRANFAGNQLVLVVPAASHSRLASFKGLSHKDVQRIAVGNPRSVPVGRYAREVLLFHKLLPALERKLIYAENARQVLDWVARGEVDAGVVYATDAASRPHEVRLVAQAQDASHTPIVYPAAVVRGTPHQAQARAFLSLLLSEAGQEILGRHGFQRATR